MCWSLGYRWIKEVAEKLKKYKIKDNIKEIEFDEIWHFLYTKHKIWVIKAYDELKKMIAWVAGTQSAKTFKKLYNKGQCETISVNPDFL